MSEAEIILPYPALPAPKPKRKLHPAMEANKWKPGQSGNPNNAPRRGAAWLEAISICREKSPDAARKMVALMDCDDPRVAYMATNAVLERAWGKPREYDPAADPDNKFKIDASKLTSEQRDQLRALIKAATEIAEQPWSNGGQP